MLRRALPGCEGYARVNDQIIPRRFGGTHTVTWGEPNPGTGTLYEYRVIAVDANHRPLFLPGLCSPCDPYQACPPLSAPVIIGTVEDAPGQGLLATPCPGTCYPGASLSGQIADQLRPHAGTGTAFRFFGSVVCSGVEGCSMTVDHWEFTTCELPPDKGSWGRLKTIYR